MDRLVLLHKYLVKALIRSSNLRALLSYRAGQWDFFVVACTVDRAFLQHCRADIAAGVLWENILATWKKGCP